MDVNKFPIPIFRPDMGEKEIANVTEVLKSGWIGLGPKTKEFEEKFAEYVGAKYAVALNSCTLALDLAIKVLEIKGKITIPALTFVSTGLAVLYNDCQVEFADVDEKTLCIDYKDKYPINATIPVHYAGRKAEYPQVDITRDEEPIVIEDSAHACGNKTVGKNLSCWSFHAVKNLATGDGGMITTNNKEIYEKLLPMRWVGIDKSTYERTVKKYGWDYSINTIGYKCHMNDITASIGLAQLERLDEMNNKRKFRVLQYLDKLKGLKWLKLPEYDEDSSWHMFVVRVKERDRFIDHMLAHGVSVGVHYKPLNTYPMFPKTKLPVTDRVWKTLATLPLFPSMTDEQFNHVVEVIKSF